MKAKVYLHSSKESMWELGEKLGLKGEALGMFKYACCEVEVEIEVSESGEEKIIKVDGREVKD